MAPGRGKAKKEEQVISVGDEPHQVAECVGVCHIFASLSDIFVHGTHLSGKETIC